MNISFHFALAVERRASSPSMFGLKHQMLIAIFNGGFIVTADYPDPWQAQTRDDTYEGLPFHH